MCLSLLIVVIDNTILNTALPTLARVLKASTTDAQRRDIKSDLDDLQSNIDAK